MFVVLHDFFAKFSSRSCYLLASVEWPSEAIRKQISDVRCLFQGHLGENPFEGGSWGAKAHFAAAAHAASPWQPGLRASSARLNVSLQISHPTPDQPFKSKCSHFSST